MRVLRLMLGLAAIAAAFLTAAILLPHSPGALREMLTGYGAAAPAIALGAWLLLTPALFPGTVLAAACGLAFGAAAGGAVALAGAVLGGGVAFALARTLARAPVESMVSRRAPLQSAARVLEQRGFQAMLAARLMPGVPATWLHYLAGASPVRPPAFAGAIAIGALLRTVPYALLGQGLGSGSLTGIALAAASIVIGGLVAAALARRLRAAAAPAA